MVPETVGGVGRRARAGRGRTCGPAVPGLDGEDDAVAVLLEYLPEAGAGRPRTTSRSPRRRRWPPSTSSEEPAGVAVAVSPPPTGERADADGEVGLEEDRRARAALEQVERVVPASGGCLGNHRAPAGEVRLADVRVHPGDPRVVREPPAPASIAATSQPFSAARIEKVPCPAPRSTSRPGRRLLEHPLGTSARRSPVASPTASTRLPRRRPGLHAKTGCRPGPHITRG